MKTCYLGCRLPTYSRSPRYLGRIFRSHFDLKLSKSRRIPSMVLDEHTIKYHALVGHKEATKGTVPYIPTQGPQPRQL